MIADVDATLEAWLGAFLPGTGITFGPPSDRAEKSGRPGRGKAELTLFLDDVREDLDAGTPGWAPVRDDTGLMVGRLPPSRTYRLSYLMVAAGADTASEHELLGRVLAGSLGHEVVAGELLAGQLQDAGEPVLVRCAPATRRVDPQHLWSAWGVIPRAWLELSVLAPMPAALVHEVAEPPTRIHLDAHRLTPALPRNGTEHERTADRPTSEIHED